MFDFEPLRHTVSPLYWARGVATGLKVEKGCVRCRARWALVCTGLAGGKAG
jgi:hypothetical protein